MKTLAVLLLLCGITHAQNRVVTVVATPQDYGAKADGVADDTAAFQRAINAHKHVHIPEGIYRINPAVGLVLRTGTVLTGDGEEASVLFALEGAGSIIKRAAPASRGDYVLNVICEKFAVVMNHPAATSGEQTAFDFRHVTRSVIRDCYAGNYPRSNCKPRPASQTDAIRGYGVVLGTMSSGLPLYSGGEHNTVDSVAIWGAKKCVVVDDLTLSPNSGAHATVIRDCDLQIAEVGIAQESKWTGGCTFVGNTIQSIQRARGSTATTYAIRIAGSRNLVDGGYIEVATGCDYSLRLEATATKNQTRIPRLAGSANGISDVGAGNSAKEYGQ